MSSAQLVGTLGVGLTAEGVAQYLRDAEAAAKATEEAAKAAAAATKRFQAMEGIVESVAGSIDILRKRQMDLAQALANRTFADDPMKLKAIQAELERTTASLNRYSGNVQKAAADVVRLAPPIQQAATKTSALAGHVGKLKEGFGRASPLIAGLSMSLGGISSTAGAATSALAGLGTVLLGGVAGAVGTGVVLGVSLLIDHMKGLEERARATETAIKAVSRGMTTALAQLGRDGAAHLRDLAKQLRGIGKSAAEAMRDEALMRTQMETARQESLRRAIEKQAAEREQAERRVATLAEEARSAITSGARERAEAAKVAAEADKARLDLGLQMSRDLLAISEATAMLAADEAVAAQRIADEEERRRRALEESARLHRELAHDLEREKALMESYVNLQKGMSRLPGRGAGSLFASEDWRDTTLPGSATLQLSSQFGSNRSALAGFHAAVGDVTTAINAWGDSLLAEGDVIDVFAGTVSKARDAFEEAWEETQRNNRALEEANERLRQFGNSLGNTIAALTAAAMEGRGFSAGGSELGGMVGGAIGSAFGPAGTGIGAALGSLLGGVLGRALDELVSVLGVLTPLFDGLAVLIKALSPVFIVLRVFTTALGRTIERLAPILHELAQPLAMVLLMFVRMAVAALLLVDALSALTTIVASAFGGVISEIVYQFDYAIFRPMQAGAAHVYNAAVNLNNAVVDIVRGWGFENFGIKLETMAIETADIYGQFANTMEELRNYGTDPLIDKLGDLGSRVTSLDNTIADAQHNLPPGWNVNYERYLSRGGGRPGQVDSWAWDSSPSSMVKGQTQQARTGSPYPFARAYFQNSING